MREECLEKTTTNKIPSTMFVNDLFEKAAKEASRLVKTKILSSASSASWRELAKHAFSEGTKAVTKNSK